MRTHLVWIALIAIGPALAPAIPAAEDGAPSLAKIVPAEVHFFANWKYSQERDQIAKQYLRAFRRLIDSGIGRDLFDLATLDQSPEMREQARNWIRQILDILKTPNWKALIKDEVAFSFRLSVPIPEYMMLFRVPADTAGERQAEFQKLFSKVAEFAPEQLAVREVERLGAKLLRLELMGAPFSLVVASKRDIVAISSSDFLLDGVLSLMDSKDASGSLAKSSRFSSGFQGLSAPEDGQIFFDFPGYLGFIKGMMGMASGAVNDPTGQGIISIAGVILDELARMGPITSVEETNGKRMYTGIKVPFLQRDNSMGFFEELIRDQKPLPDGCIRVVPEDALGFYMTSGISFLKIYDALTELVKERLPNGQGLLEQWQSIQNAVGFHLREDLLSWIDGGFGWISLPGKPAGTETVFFLRLRDEEKAREIILKALEKAKNFLTRRGQAIEFAAVPDMGEAFREVRIQAFPWLRPVIGIPGDYLVVGSSVDAVQRIGAAFGGEAPNFTEHPSYKGMLVPDRPLSEVFFYDVENSLELLANLVSGAGFVASILPENRDTRPVLKVGAILTKLAAFIREVDLLVEFSGWTYYDAEGHAIISKQMARVKASEETF